MRVLLDTNVLAASIVGAIRGSSKPPARIWQHWLDRRFELLTSEHVLAELDRTFADPWFVARIDPGRRDEQRDFVVGNATMVTVVANVEGIASHPSDDFVLAAAVSGEADYLVTGDAEFRRVGDYRGVKIRTPAEFLSETEP